MKKILKNKKGFTIIELLVVLAIIGILVGLAIAGIRIVQQVNRDTQRKAFVKDVQTILASYENDNYDYPNTLSFGECDTGELEIDTGDPDNVMCSKVNFDINLGNDCTAYVNGEVSGKEPHPGDISGCYEGAAKAYYIYILLERSEDPYNGSNAE